MLLPLALAFQTAIAAGPAAPPRGTLAVPPAAREVPAPTATGATASRAVTAPVLDGSDNDDIWRTAPAITQFRQHDPVEDGEPKFRTEAKIAYDDRYLYVFVRAFDPSPDSVMAFLSRRDARTQSDYIHIMVDAYNDKRTGFRFTVNPVGVKRDFYISNDGMEDASWDGVWDASTVVDGQGWTAEFRVPFSQLRYPEAQDHTFGFSIWREIGRANERISWPLYRRSQTGFVSQWGEVEGFAGISSPRRLEFLPYSVATDAARPTGNRFPREQSLALGADIKYGITSNLTLDGTVNPDFGQVEADPAVLNLSAFEQFFQERRPFFLEGAGIFNFPAANLFYSRRVGRSPQLGGVYAAQDNPLNTTILGAAKVTGRTASGLNVGLLSAVSQQELGAGGRTIEPQTGYFVARLQQDLRNGNSGIGVMLTAMDRALDADSEDYLRDQAFSLGLDLRHRFWSNNYQLQATAIGTHVTGSEEAMRRTQLSSARFFQRPDSRFTVDPNMTSMTGNRVGASVGKTGGGITRFNFGINRASPELEVNDLGFLPRVDMLNQNNWIGFQWQRPTRIYRRAFFNINQWNEWNTDGLALNTGGNINGELELTSQRWVWAGYNVNGVGERYDDRNARGGPAMRRNLRHNIWWGTESDGRKPLVWRVMGYAVFPDAAGTREWGTDPSITFRVASRIQGSLGVGYAKADLREMWYNNYNTPGGTVHTFARLQQTTSSVTARFDYTMTPTLSLQVYAQPFITGGDYSNLRQLVDARAEDPADRYAPYTDDEPIDFNIKQFRSNTVLRWEYRPGSVLFLVWQQGRGQFDRNPGTFDIGRDYSDLFKTRADNTFLVKMSYWFSM